MGLLPLRSERSASASFATRAVRTIDKELGLQLLELVQQLRRLGVDAQGSGNVVAGPEGQQITVEHLLHEGIPGEQDSVHSVSLSGQNCKQSVEILGISGVLALVAQQQDPGT